MSGGDQSDFGVAVTAEDLLFDKLSALGRAESAALVVRATLGSLDASEAERILSAVIARMFPDGSVAGVVSGLMRIGRDDLFDDDFFRLGAERRA